MAYRPGLYKQRLSLVSFHSASLKHNLNWQMFLVYLDTSVKNLIASPANYLVFSEDGENSVVRSISREVVGRTTSRECQRY